MPSDTAPSALPVGLNTLSAQVREIVGTIIGISPDMAREDAEFVADLEVTSLDFVELVMAVEEVFEIEISDTAADRIVTVADLITYVEAQRARKASSTVGADLPSDIPPD